MMGETNTYIPWDLTTLFEVLREPKRTEKGIRLVLQTDKGPRTIWCPKKAVNLYRYRHQGRVVLEASVPDWLAQKASLI